MGEREFVPRHSICNKCLTLLASEVFLELPLSQIFICIVIICSVTLSQAAVVAFFYSLAEVGLHASLMVPP